MNTPITTTQGPATTHLRARVQHVRAGRATARQAVRAEADRTPVPTDQVVTESRPWGTFEQFVCNEQVTVKVITVQPGQRLSLQCHDHRGEMWQVLDGPIDVTLDSRTWTAQAGEKVWVPQGAVHRMGNSGTTPGRVLEVAFGHFDEDDIHRLEDDYERRP